jgi:MFS family permease
VTVDPDRPRAWRNWWRSWLNVLVAALIMLATLPGRTQGLGLITEPLLRDLQVGHLTYANVNLWATLLGAAMCLPIGRVLDRFGLRVPTAVLIVLLGLVVWQTSVLRGGVLALFALVLATRALGQSALSVASITAVGKSFDREVGMAMGVFAVLLSVMFAAAFVGIGAVVRGSGWRTAWLQVAFALFALAPLVLLALREPAPGATAPDALAPAGEGLSLAGALRTPAFWVFGVAASLFGLASSGLGLFNEAVLAERGFDQKTYHTFLAVTSLFALAGQFLCGWLTMRRSIQWLLGLAMLIYAASLAALPLLHTLVHLWIFAVLIGVAGGMITVIFFAVWRQAFGAAHLGRIQGAAQMLTVLASALGPVIFAACASWTGTYTPALWLLAACVLFFAAAAFRVPLPERAARES